jgi:hypothetical protein
MNPIRQRMLEIARSVGVRVDASVLDRPTPSQPRRPIYNWLGIVAIAVIVVPILWLQIAEWRAGSAFKNAVEHAEQVRLNGTPVESPAPLLASLGEVSHASAHHSHPLTPIRIDLIDASGEVQVIVARDSQRPNEFWAFWPDGRVAGDHLGQEAGRIDSAELDAFLHQRGL